MAPNHDERLFNKLAEVLPQGHEFSIYHLSTPPTKSAALCSAPPNERPDRTFCESHFLGVCIKVPDSELGVSTPSKTAKNQVLVLGVEILLYTTAYSTTLFVSKADSTGYLNLLKLPRGSPSPVREVCATFIAHLVESRRRDKKQFVVSLFARAQSQYLFPGSAQNSNKHVLDDRGLIKWWCRVLNPLLETPPRGSQPGWKSVQGYLVVPGLDTYETRGFVPRPSLSKWSLTHPLERISHYHREFDWVPPRCLIPRYPDDPKSRFRDELDEEAARSGAMQKTGVWKSVKTLDLFWEMMAYRQECSSGRMTGFIWVVFDDKPVEKEQSAVPETPKKQRQQTIITTPSTTPRKLFSKRGDENGDSQPSVMTTTPKPKKKPKKKKSESRKIRLKGIIKPRLPRVKQQQKNYLADLPESTAYYYWPESGRGEKLFTGKDYKRINELLIHLDFATLEKAVGSSRRWISEVGMGSTWGYHVTGTREAAATQTTDPAQTAQVNNLSGLVKRKREDPASNVDTAPDPNMLGGGLVRKKPKQVEAKSE